MGTGILRCGDFSTVPVMFVIRRKNKSSFTNPISKNRQKFKTLFFRTTTKCDHTILRDVNT